MQIDRRFTNGLAWAGVLLVVGVPAADLVMGQFSGAPERVAVVAPQVPLPAPLNQRPDAAVAANAAAKPDLAPVAAPAQTADAVGTYLQSGRQLPSYITDAGAPAAPAQVAATAPPARTPVVTTPAQTEPAKPDPVTVAAIPPRKVAPVPMPLSMRPQPVSVALVQDPVVIPPGVGPAPVVQQPVNVTAADLEDWETGPLSEFLARRQGQAGNAYADPGYDSEVFFLD